MVVDGWVCCKAMVVDGWVCCKANAITFNINFFEQSNSSFPNCLHLQAEYCCKKSQLWFWNRFIHSTRIVLLYWLSTWISIDLLQSSNVFFSLFHSNFIHLFHRQKMLKVSKIVWEQLSRMLLFSDFSDFQWQFSGWDWCPVKDIVPLSLGLDCW